MNEHHLPKTYGNHNKIRPCRVAKKILHNRGLLEASNIMAFKNAIYDHKSQYSEQTN